MSTPNIVLITSDQHRADALGIAGNPVIQTPNLDQIAHEGMIFDRAYSDCPVCIPARTTMITGRQAHHNGVPSYSEDARIGRERPDYLGSLVTAAGYQTALIGKTHWHTETTFRGGFESVTWTAQLRREQFQRTGRSFGSAGLGFNQIAAGLSVVPPELQSSYWLTERAIEFLQLRERDQPFMLWVSYVDPHPPFLAHEPYFSMYEPGTVPHPYTSDWSSEPSTCPRSHFVQQRRSKTVRLSVEQTVQVRSVYYGMITHMDHQIGRLMGTLERLGLSDDTVVIYTSDHGELLGDHGSAAKSCFLDGAARVPLMVRFPRAWRRQAPNRVGSRSQALVQHADILPTICEITEARVPEDVDGRSLIPSLIGDADHHHDGIHGHINDTHMWLDDRHKYVYYADDGAELLFDVGDATERTPVALRSESRCDGNRELLDEYRSALVGHMRAESHTDLDESGRELVDRGLPKPSDAECLARSGSGMRALGAIEYDLASQQRIH